MKLSHLQEASYHGSHIEKWIRNVISDAKIKPGDSQYDEFDADEDPLDELHRLFGEPDEHVGQDAWTWEIADDYGILYVRDEDDRRVTVEVTHHIK